jgi:hypothetical protein
MEASSPPPRLPHIESAQTVRVSQPSLRTATAPSAACSPKPPTAAVEIVAPATILATGGLGGLFAVTTNPVRRARRRARARRPGRRGDADPEFVQFHPTAIDVDADPAPLATEALRGEGAILVDAAGRPFMADHHPLAELAPRDVVARAIHRQRLTGGGAFLDATKAVGDHFRTSSPPSSPPAWPRDRPARPADPGRPGGALPHGWDRHGPGRPAPACPASTPPASALDRRPRRQPPGQQQPARGRRVRRSRRPCRRVGARPRHARAAEPPRPRPAPTPTCSASAPR